MTKRPEWITQVRPYARPALIIVLVAVLAVTTYLLVQDIGAFMSSTQPTPFHRLRLFPTHIPPTTLTVGEIQPWMTFDYLDRVFALPTDYLKTSLMITDTRYPRMSILRLSRDLKESATSTVASIQDAIRLHQAASSTTP